MAGLTNEQLRGYAARLRAVVPVEHGAGMAEELLRLREQVGKSVLWDAVEKNIRGWLNGEYACTRVWSAWDAGTMTQDDFVPFDIDAILADIRNDSDALMKGAAK